MNNNIVVILRDFKNWVASCVRMAHRDSQVLKEEILSDETIKLYMDHCRYYHELNGDHYILFNKGVRDKEYRREEAEKLGLEFTDSALSQLSPFGGGSSFSGMTYLKSANSMRVNDRYRGMAGDADYERIIKENKRALEMSNEIFGSVN